MSGGSWDYLYSKVDDCADQLISNSSEKLLQIAERYERARKLMRNA